MSVQKVAEAVAEKESSWRDTLRDGWNRRKGNSALVFADAAFGVLSLLLARCHVALGAYPLAIAHLSALSHRVWVCLLGAVLGALSLGRAGVVYAMTAVITVLLRVVISGVGRKDAPPVGVLFGEGRLLRASAAVIGGCICAVYEVLLGGLTLTTALYGACMIVGCGVLCLVFSGVQACDISTRELVFSEAPLFEGLRCRRCEVRPSVEYQLAVCAYLFFFSLSLSGVSFFGISLGYVAAAAATLFAARRFGGLRAMTVGFVSTLGLSAPYAVSYAIGGLTAGLLYPLGGVYALLSAVCAVGAWSALSTGLAGFVSVVPEFAVCAALFLPVSRHLCAQHTAAPSAKSACTADDMVGTMALTHRSDASRMFVGLEQAIASLSPILSRLSVATAPDVGEYRRLLEDTVDELSRAGTSLSLADATLSPMLDTLSVMLAGGVPLNDAALLPLGADADVRRVFLGAYERRYGAWQAERFRRQRTAESAELYEVMAKMMNEVRLRAEREDALDAELSRRLTELLPRFGLPGGCVRAYGDRQKYLLVAAEDVSGERITSEAFHAALTETVGLRLDTPSYFRKDAMVLMECRTRPRYLVKAATASAARGEEVSGDSAACFEGADGCCYLVLSDGMGSGEVARRTSDFSVDYLSRMMGTGCTEGTALFLLNRLIRGREEECSATVDMFAFDLTLGEGQFYKSGAAASYVKRAGSLFRIRSQTAPVGLLRTLDAERIRVEVQAEDVIILLSDGISGTPEDDPWLVEYLSRQSVGDLQTYAEGILAEARRRVQGRDDMTVLVARIEAAA